MPRMAVPLWMIIITMALAVLIRPQLVSACNEAVCASVVSKCTLLRSCDCQIEATGCSCCKKCFACLEYLQADCCSCVGLCPAPNSTAAIMQKSIVAEFEETVPQLWEALTAGDDPQGRWQKFTFPVELTSSRGHAESAATSTTSATTATAAASTTPSGEERPVPSSSAPNMCTVVYLSQCTADTKCQLGCQSMGAASYRWFSDGCCQCVGPNCINYGINESRCEKCSFDDDDDDLSPDTVSDEELDRLERIYKQDLDAMEQEPEGPSSTDSANPSAAKSPKK